MPFNGSGTFNLIYNWEQDAINSIKIRADRMDGQEQDMAANGFGNTITRDGQGSATANQPMNGFVHTGVGNATLTNEYAVVGQIQNNSYLFSVAGGSTSDVLTAAFTPATTLTDGEEHCVRAKFANQTTTPTYSADGNTAYPITKLGGLPLAIGDIANPLHELRLRYNLANTRWELINPAGVQNQVNANKFINGVWGVDQRNNFGSISITTSRTFFADRWYAYVTGTAVTGQRQLASLVSIPGGTYYQFTGATGNTSLQFGYRAESADCFDIAYSPSTITFSFFGFSVGTMLTITYTISSPNAVDNFSAVTTRQTITKQVTVGTGVTTVSQVIAANANYANGCQIEINPSGSGLLLAATYSIMGMKWEVGSNATPLQDEPIGETLSKCLRYYRVIGTKTALEPFGTAQAVSTTICWVPFLFEQMRAAPSVTVTGATDFFVSTAGGGSNITSAVTTDRVTAKNFRALFTSTGLVAGNASFVFANNGTGSFQLSAEL